MTTLSHIGLYALGGLAVVWLIVAALGKRRKAGTRRTERRGSGGDGDTLEGVERRNTGDRRARD